MIPKIRKYRHSQYNSFEWWDDDKRLARVVVTAHAKFLIIILKGNGYMF